jgi:7-cyano-7-deazaguanine synthase
MEIHGTAKAELKAARRLGRRGGVIEHRFLRIPGLREASDIAGSRELSGRAVPPTYIPMKNAIFYSLAAAYAEEKGSDRIVGGHNGDDRLLFEDTSDGFFDSLQRTLLASSPRLRKGGLEILRPLKDRGKAEVVALAREIGVPLQLTWSCHRAGTKHCWKCDGCVGRTEAFAAAGVQDPLASKKV